MHEEKHLKQRNLYFQVINQAWKQIFLDECTVQKVTSSAAITETPIQDVLKQEKGENRKEEKKGKQIQATDASQNGHGEKSGWVYTQPRATVITQRKATEHREHLLTWPLDKCYSQTFYRSTEDMK